LDYSSLPDLVEIGGFQYESGCRDFAGWAASMATLLGESIGPLLREVWECIPRSAAEKFGALLQGALREEERLRLAERYRQMGFRYPGQEPGTSLAADLTAMTEPADRVPGSETAAGEDGAFHTHTCARCGLIYSHEAWQCEPPDDQYCNLCSESVAGPSPVWIERLNEPVTSSGRTVPKKTMENRTDPAPKFPPEPTQQPQDRDIPKPDPGMAKPPQAVPQPPPETVPAGSAGIPNPTERGFKKVAGMQELKQLLLEEVVSALRDPDDLKAYGLTIPNGILLFGPPGCGKTYISRQLAEEMNYFFKEVFPSEIGSTFIHETTLKIREVFDHAYAHAPAIIFVDEFESMVPARRNLGAHQQHTAEEVSEFLKQLEASAERRILLIAATNEPWKIDPAVQRTGRLDKKIYVGPPDKHARAEMLRFHLYGRRQEEAIDVEALADSLVGYSASDLKLLVDEAARLARKLRRPISETDLRTAVRERVPASVTAEDEQKYLAFGQRGVKTVEPNYVVGNSSAPDYRPVDLVRKWGRGRPAGRGSSRSTP
jgi:AAA+ superfamily predicted ATPase